MSMGELWAGPTYNALRVFYALEGLRGTWESWLVAHPLAATLLYEAVRPLRERFAMTGRLRARLTEHEGDVLAKVIVSLPVNWHGDAEQALHCFDEAWWFQHCHLSEGLLVFDYEQEPALRESGLMPFTSAYY